MTNAFTNFAKSLERIFPSLEDNLRRARLKDKVIPYLKKALRNGFAGSFLLTFLCLMLFSKFGLPMILLPVIFVSLFAGIFLFFIQIPTVYIRKHQQAIDRNILFAGRYILIKIESGQPLYTILLGVSKSFGETGRAFREIIRYIQVGDSIDKALDRGVAESPSENMRKILWELSSSLKTGTDIKRSMTAILAQIHEEYIIKIEAYGKKLNSVTLFYMVVGIIAPSLGLTMFVVIATFIKITLPLSALFGILFGLIVIQFFFISIFRSIRPAVDL